MKHLLAIAFALFSLSAFSQLPSAKRGLGYGQNRPDDLESLSKGLTWYYNWFHQPESSVINVYQDYNFDYVPMAWNGAFNKEGMRNFISTHPNVKYILGFNEPNFIDQAKMTPSEAAAKWPEIEAIADEFNLKIVGPAVNYCGNCVSENGTTYTDPVEYLDDFFAACEGCRVDYIAIHCYMEHVSALQYYVGLFKKYEKPIWLTEFAGWETQPTLQQQKNFMVGAVDYLESDPDVFRYAWFTGKFDNVSPFIGLLKNFGELTELGEIYVNMPLHDPSVYTPIPARIEGEAYNKMLGVSLEATQDVSGLAQVSFIDASDWMEYNIEVPKAATYDLKLRISSQQAGFLYVIKGEETLATLNYTNTGGLQMWKTVTLKVDLEPGQQTLRLTTPSGGFNLNWIDIAEEVIVGLEEDQASIVRLFPNPASDIINIEAPSEWTKLEILNSLGVKCRAGEVPTSVSLDGLTTGTYIVKFTSNEGRVMFKRIIKL